MPVVMAYGIIHTPNLPQGKNTGEDRLNAASGAWQQVFKKSKLSMKDIDNDVKSVRRKAYEKKK